MNPHIDGEKNPKKLTCELCAFVSSKESNYNKHLLTLKHKRLSNPNAKNATAIVKTYNCKCGKTYKHLSTLSAHKKTCSLIQNIQIDIQPVNNNVVIENNGTENKVIELLIQENSEFKNIVLELIKSNSDLQKQLIDVCKNSNITNTNISNNNNNNKTFNLQFFLNEQCKDAMNISEFANTFDLQLADLESVGELGYVDGITKIIVDKLNSMDIYKRPMHCSDAKREIIYVKDENVWTKEDKNSPKLRQAIKNISFKNMKLVYNWSNAYPESKDNKSRLNDTYIKLVLQSTGGNAPIVESENKIIRRIAKEILIAKF
jgi:hypothetical protein